MYFFPLSTLCEASHKVEREVNVEEISKILPRLPHDFYTYERRKEKIAPKLRTESQNQTK